MFIRNVPNTNIRRRDTAISYVQARLYPTGERETTSSWFRARHCNGLERIKQIGDPRITTTTYANAVSPTVQEEHAASSTARVSYSSRHAVYVAHSTLKVARACFVWRVRRSSERIITVNSPFDDSAGGTVQPNDSDDGHTCHKIRPRAAGTQNTPQARGVARQLYDTRAARWYFYTACCMLFLYSSSDRVAKRSGRCSWLPKKV